MTAIRPRAGLRQGEALALHRRLSDDPDRLTLYASLSNGGRRNDTFLLERAVGPSLLMDEAAVRVECRGSDVTLDALTANGNDAMVAVEARLSGYVSKSEASRLILRFPPVTGDEAEARLTAPSPFDVLRAITGLTSASPEDAFTVTAMGVVAFDHVDLFEALPANAQDPLGYPDFVFWLASSLIVFEAGAKPRLVCTAFGSDDPAAAERAYFGAAERLTRLVERCGNVAAMPVPVKPLPGTAEPEVDLDDNAFAGIVADLRERIAAGDIYQIVPSRTFRVPCVDPLRAYAAQRALDPSPYQFFVAGERHVLFGASPETSVRVFADGAVTTVEVKPIAGTCARGNTLDEDDRLEAEMRLDDKETAEHMMLVDLARNDVARVSVRGTRRVAALLRTERYARLMHLVSSVQGRLRDGLDALHALQACLNVGTLTGAPKIRAMQLLRETEVTKRGPYGGAVGWINGRGHMDTGVVIRSAVVMDGIAYVRAGAGVVFDSDPMRETAETRRKASALLSVLAAVDQR